MKINFVSKTIELTKTEASKSRKLNSTVCQELEALLAKYPSFNVIVAENKKASSVFKGLGNEYMENYIKAHDESGEIMAEFLKLRNDHTAHGAMKKWFFEKYPQFKSFTTRTEWILAA